jgi:hypothetical protein
VQRKKSLPRTDKLRASLKVKRYPLTICLGGVVESVIRSPTSFFLSTQSRVKRGPWYQDLLLSTSSNKSHLVLPKNKSDHDVADIQLPTSLCL